MSTSGPPELLLSPPLEIPQQSRKSNSSVDSRNSYFSSVSSRAVPPGGDSPFEGPITPSCLSLGLASPSCASDYGSEYSSESQYLTPPQNKGDNEKPPYKARSESAASLDMTASQSDDMVHREHKHRVTKRHAKHKRRPLLENNAENAPRSQEQVFPGCKERATASEGLDKECGRLGTFVKSIGGLNNSSKSLSDFKVCSSQIMSRVADNITTRRWSSGGIVPDEPPRKNSVVSDPTSAGLAMESRKRSNSWKRVPNNDEIMRVVRTRLTFREVPTNHLLTPAAITLRRASGIPIDLSGGSPTNAGLQWSESQPPASTYLITTDDVDFITNLIQSGFDVKKTAVDIPSGGGMAPRKPSITSQGVLPLSSIPAHLTTTIADVHQAQNVPRISFKDSRVPDSKPTMGSIRKLSRTLSLKIAPEVIWEDPESRGSQTTSSRASFSSEEHGEVMDDSSTAWLLGQSSSVMPEVSSPHGEPPEEHRSKSNDDGDNSPRSRVFQWVFKEPTDEMLKALGPFPKQTALDERPQSPTLPSERNSFPSISLFSPDVVSFPPLPSRKFTSDWISPLPDMSAPSSDDGKCLYGFGIDAQVGSGSKDPAASLPYVGRQEAPGNAALQPRNSPSPDSDSQMRRKSVNLLHPNVAPRLGNPFKVGNALGCSSGARRKSSTQSVRLEINDEASEHHFHEDQTSWVKPRKDSGWPAPKTPSPEELDSRKPSHTLLPPFINAQGQITKGILKREDRFDLIKGQMPLLPEPDHSGIYAAMTGTQADGGKCELNCQKKHMCSNTPFDSRNPSSDWIG